MGVEVVSARRSWRSHQGCHGALTKAALVLSKAVSLRQATTKAATCSVHGGHSCQARLVQGLGDRHCGGLGAVTVTALALSEAGTFPTVNPRPVGSGAATCTFCSRWSTSLLNLYTSAGSHGRYRITKPTPFEATTL